MVKRGLLAEVRQLQRAERHIRWLRTNLPKHSITRRVERELQVRRTDLAIAAGDTAERVVKRATGRGSASPP